MERKVSNSKRSTMQATQSEQDSTEISDPFTLGQPLSFAPTKDIGEIIKFIVVDKLGCRDVVYTPWVDILKKNLIANLGLLVRVSPERLEKLQLPLLLEEELISIIKSYRKNNEIKPFAVVVSGAADHKRGVDTVSRSAFLGLTENERKMILESWNRVLQEQGNNLTAVFEKFYQSFFNLDKTARRLFQGRSLEKQSRALLKVIKMIMSTLEDPTTMLPYVQRLGTRHLIYGIYQKDFQSWAIAFTQTLSEFVPNIMTAQLKEAWFILITKLGHTMTESYDAITQGVKCKLGKTSDKEKKKLHCLLTHQCLAIYKDEELTKEINTVWFKWVTDIDVVSDDKYTKNFPYCFAFSLGDIKFHYGVDTSDDLSWWIDELGERVAAHHRIAGEEDDISESSSEQLFSPALSRKQSNRLKKLKKKLKKTRSSTPPTTNDKLIA